MSICVLRSRMSARFFNKGFPDGPEMEIPKNQLDKPEQRVNDRTAEFEKINKEFKLMINVFTGQEIRMIEPKEIIKDFEEQIAPRGKKRG